MADADTAPRGSSLVCASIALIAAMIVCGVSLWMSWRRVDELERRMAIIEAQTLAAGIDSSVARGASNEAVRDITRLERRIGSIEARLDIVPRGER